MAVAYKDIARTGNESIFGDNDKSWALECVDEGTHLIYNFKHNANKTSISDPQSQKVGVFMDYKAGTLCFYSVKCETVTRLYKVKTTFTQPLYAGLGVYFYGSTAEFCDITQTGV